MHEQDSCKKQCQQPKTMISERRTSGHPTNPNQAKQHKSQTNTQGVMHQKPGHQPPTPAVPILYGGPCRVQSSVVPCKPLSCVPHDACAACMLWCADLVFDVLT